MVILTRNYMKQESAGMGSLSLYSTSFCYYHFTIMQLQECYQLLNYNFIANN